MTRFTCHILLVLACLSIGCGHHEEHYRRFCSDGDDSPEWHLLIYLDKDACLTCNEDMDALRELVTLLREGHHGVISVFALPEDSSDVYWAMKLEGISDTVNVLTPEEVDELGWSDLGTPLKVLLDINCRPMKIGGRKGSKKDARCFIEEMRELIKKEPSIG